MAGFLALYNKVTNLPGGRFLFNHGIGFSAPFFGTIRPNVIELQPARCTVEMQDRRRVRNHIKTVNAGAMCTLIELCAGLAVDATVPAGLRWLPRGMTVAYLKKGKGTLTAVCQFDESVIQPGDIVIPVTITNTNGEDVCTAEVTFYISHRK